MSEEALPSLQAHAMQSLERGAGTISGAESEIQQAHSHHADMMAAYEAAMGLLADAKSKLQEAATLKGLMQEKLKDAVIVVEGSIQDDLNPAADTCQEAVAKVQVALEAAISLGVGGMKEKAEALLQSVTEATAAARACATSTQNGPVEDLRLSADSAESVTAIPQEALEVLMAQINGIQQNPQLDISFSSLASSVSAAAGQASTVRDQVSNMLSA